MKHQFNVMLFCIIAFVTFLISCQKESANLQKRDSPIQKNHTPKSPNENEFRRLVPFKGTYSTTIEVLSAPPIQQSRITGIGEASHLGESKFVALSTANFTTLPPFQIAGTAIFYSDNGDVFYTSFNGSITPKLDGTRLFVINMNIKGGTGRFEHASGSFVGNSIVNITQPSNTITFEGNISYEDE